VPLVTLLMQSVRDSTHFGKVFRMPKILEEKTLTSWHLYITITSSTLAVLGIINDALEPMIKWLDGDKALIWLLVCFPVSVALFFVIRTQIRRSGLQILSIQYIPKFVSFGLFWTIFPYMVCTGTVVFGDPTKDCLCNNIQSNITITFKKHEDIARVADGSPLELLLKRTKNIKPAHPEFKHPEEIQRILDAMSREQLSEETKSFVKEWGHKEKEIKTSLIRLLAEFSSSPLVESELSREFYQRMKFQLSRREGSVVLGGAEALEALQAIMESEVTYEPMVDDHIIEATKKFLSLTITKLYGHLKYVPKHYAVGIDPDFLRFIEKIPSDHQKTVLKVGYPGNALAVITFECGNPPKGARVESYSRFYVPEGEIRNSAILRQMRQGPWPIGSPSKLFSEDWWLQHAAWQMLGRESGRFLDNLALRINDFDQCGPP
jgi:hypothetical protein